jgi:hypothetical protein
VISAGVERGLCPRNQVMSPGAGAPGDTHAAMKISGTLAVHRGSRNRR